jgi:tRNA1(Val) A37 N6-methylase TrmN6
VDLRTGERKTGARFTGVERQTGSSSLPNRARGRTSSAMSFLAADVQTRTSGRGEFTAVVMKPPYFETGEPSPMRPSPPRGTARRRRWNVL